MKKIYYLKQEVNLGDFIDVDGLKIKVTKKLITNNPDKFTEREDIQYVRCIASADETSFSVHKVYAVQHDCECKNFLISNYKYPCRSELVFGEKYIDYYNSYTFEPATKADFDNYKLYEEAKKNYPIGTRFGVAHQPNIICTVANHEWHDVSILINDYNGEVYINFNVIGENLDTPSASVYGEGNWAKKYPLICKSQDGVDIYDGDQIYFVETDHEDNDMAWKPQSRTAKAGDSYFRDGGKDVIPFVKLSACNEWIEENRPKEKSLSTYEDSLLSYHKEWSYYQKLKSHDPKLYWLKILQIIADDLNGDWVADYNDKKRNYIIRKVHGSIEVEFFKIINYPIPAFESKAAAEKAIKIMGDKINKIF